MLYPPDVDLAAKIRMPTIINFQFLTDMGRMNGQWRSDERPGYLPGPIEGARGRRQCTA
ncbi:hypothetical protein AM571_PA00225 (plasmid) [Rhizobium etli 8C-3]|uniref:Uncharacterized protein n=1 Tax=Rhizobium etli 8C-3 TaxID=538025 RepID=A0A1L5PAH5_RHIET|nr:hypothetical protein AM571_PA00225 [Rhizobium etli 8C-3]